MPPSAWVLNLDAEYELASTDAHTPSARTMRLLPELVRALLPLFGPDDVVVDDASTRSGTTAALPPSYVGRAWCPTPRALARLRRAGAVPIAAPAIAVLRRVNDRRFNAELGQTLPGARFVSTAEELAAVIAGVTPSGHWLMKRPFGFAGRGRRRVARGALDPALVTWVEASFRAGDGLQVEPWVERVADYGLHGFVAENGAITLGKATRQICDDTGAWKGTTLATDLEPADEASLHVSANAAAVALRDAGYFGPFGIDGYRWHEGGNVHFNARSEINARYSMGWAIGMQHRRVDLA